MSFLPLLILIAPLAAVPKIYLGQIWLALFFDLLFLVLIVRLFARGAWGRIPISVGLVVGGLNLIALLEIFNPELQEMYNALHGYRSTGLYMLAMYIPLVTTIKERELNKVVKYVIVVAVLSSIYAVRQYVYPLGVEVDYADTAGGAAKFLGDDYQGGAGSFRPFATFVTSVHLALFLSIALVAAYFQNRHRTAFFRAAPLIIAGGIIITLSRTSYLAVLGMVGLMYCAGLFAGSVNVSRTVAYLLAAVLGLGVVVSSSDLIMARMGTLANVEDVSSFQSRFDLWIDALVNIVNAPLGYGTGSASWAFKDTLSLGCDSGYLKAFIEFGWVGGAFFSIFMVAILLVSLKVEYVVFRQWRKMRVMPVECVWLLASAALVQTNLIQMTTNQTLEAYPNNFLFWLSCGFLLAYKKYCAQAVARFSVCRP